MTAPTEAGNKPVPVRLIIFAVVFLCLFAVGTTMKDELVALGDWFKAIGFWGPVIYVIFFVLITPLGAPVSALILIAGVIFGPWVGTLSCVIGTTLSASLGFAISRYLLHDQVVGWLGEKPAFHKLNHLLDTEGEISISLTRLVPLLPFMMLNYAFAVTDVDFKKFFIWTFAGMVPVNIFYAAGGDAAVNLFSGGPVPWGSISAVVGSGIALLVLVFWARKRTGASEAQSEPA